MKIFYILFFAFLILCTGCGHKGLFFRDRDKDGIANADDICPEVKGSPEFQGCPDRDGDGIPDKDDSCPDKAGPAENKGCPWPDSDGDGILDKDDSCPTVAGPAENNGCPWLDSDGDNILDKDDACPTVSGLADYYVCPKPSAVGTPKTYYNLRKFPDQPPSPSDVEVLSRNYFKNAKNLESVNKILLKALKAQQYYRSSYYYTDNGFVLVTQLEQTNKIGKSLNGESRWSMENGKNDNFSIKRYINALFTAQPGYYRCIVFVIHTQPILFSNVAADTPTVDKMMEEGGTDLPAEIGEKSFTSKHKVTALIYQFKKPEQSSKAKLIRPTTIPGQHLKVSGITKHLKP